MSCCDARDVGNGRVICGQTGRAYFAGDCCPGRDCYRPDDGSGAMMCCAVIGWAALLILSGLLVFGIWVTTGR